MAILWRGYARAKETREWPKVPAVVLVSQVGERQLGREVPKEYTHELVFEYRIDGEFHRSKRLKRRENPFFKKREKVEPYVEKYPVGGKVEAFVNAENPEEAVLEHETKAPGYTIWFPGLFLVGGLVLFLRAIFKMFGKAED